MPDETPVKQSGGARARNGGRRRMRFAAECETCGLHFDTGDRDRDRMAARRHAQREGHLVCAETSRLTYYDGRPNG